MDNILHNEVKKLTPGSWHIWDRERIVTVTEQGDVFWWGHAGAVQGKAFFNADTDTLVIGSSNAYFAGMHVTEDAAQSIKDEAARDEMRFRDCASKLAEWDQTAHLKWLGDIEAPGQQ